MTDVSDESDSEPDDERGDNAPGRKTPIDVLEDSVLLRRGAIQLLRLVQLATELAAAPDLDALLRTISEGLTRLLNATRTTIYVYDAKSQEIWSRAYDRLEIREIRLPLGRGIAGQVASRRMLLHVPDVTKSEFFAPEIDKKTGFTTKSILAAPMLNLRKGLIGVIEVLNKKSGSFTEDDEELLRLFASYAAVAIEAQLLEEEMRRRERMAAIGALAGSIVHDIRNMAALVSGWIDLIGEGDQGAPGTTSTGEIIDVIRGETDKMIDLTEEILDFAKGAEGKVVPRRVDLDRTLNELVKLLDREFQVARVNLKFVPGGAGPTKIDVRRFRRVVLNLAQNARKVLPRGGTLTVRTRRENDAVHVEFEDDGPGIPSTIRGRLFTPFTSAGDHGGTGLGLAICRSIVEAHQGTIAVRDRNPHGTIFEIMLPGDKIGATGQYPLDGPQPPSN